MSDCPHNDEAPQDDDPFTEASEEVRDALADKWEDVAEGVPDGPLRDLTEALRDVAQTANKVDDFAAVADAVIDEVYGPTTITPSETPSTHGVPNEAWVAAGLPHWVGQSHNTSSNAWARYTNSKILLSEWARGLFGGSDGQEGGSGPGRDPDSAGEGSSENTLPEDGAFPCPPISPLVIDLDGDGIELLSLEHSDVHFDLDNNGFAEKTGWVSPDDALLALDLNNNGVIDNQAELFGNDVGHENGFSKLSELDSNGDGIIDASDDQFSDLLLWQDLNSSGTSEENELQGLSQAGLIRIDLNAATVSETNEGNLISDRSSVTWSDGSSSSIEDVWFQNDPKIGDFILPENFEFSTEALFMPRLFGYGNLPSTLVSFSTSNELLASGIELISQLEAGNVASFRENFVEFLFQWADVDSIDPTSRGSYVDARKLAFLEVIYGRDFVQDGDADPRQNAGDDLDLQFDTIANDFAARFMAESPSSSLALGRIESPTDHPLFSLSYFASLRNPEFDTLHETGRFEFVMHELWDEVSAGVLEASNSA
ncbi:hypothetical protein N6L27_07465 [Leisingera sp. SS27]|uniref:hypothetical protein n=1 Tax=Leisingera sp. SS27 TaxID=2979462 RepID=UPI00232DF3A1|nr:hypothetical protein [Leisingera sp. SS27]MDC0657826.1 hypothetical protein [Leisingera sp. SS27]